MESTDSTLDIAKKYGCKIVTFPRGEHKIVEPARDFAIHSASNPWVFVVDADEIVTKELHDFLYEAISKPHHPQGFYIPRRNKFMGQYIGKSMGDWQLRFFVKDGTTWSPIIHSVPKVNGKVARVPCSAHNARIMHLDDEELHDRLEKLNRYTDSEVIRKQNKHYTDINLFINPLWCFLQSYFIKHGVFYGRRGFIKAVSDATYKFYTIAKILEKKIK